ncbi:MAG: sensor histidine kinase [Pyrinomonadaceae bacterium]|nr:sensor histidine kinase [Pyrinomonadaceae bacterium]
MPKKGLNKQMINEPKLSGKWVKWLGIWTVWTLFGVFFASQFALQNQLSKNPVPFWKILSWQMVSGYVWFGLSPLILYLARKFPFEAGKWQKSLTIHFSASLLIAFFQQAIDTFLLTKLGYPPNREFANFLEAYKFFVYINLHLSILIYWGVVGIKSAYSYYQKYRERELQTSQLEARLATSRLQVLKMQLHPHFLFNTLNAISELIYKDAEAAERMLGDLSDLLRMSFEKLEIQEISLKQELEFLKKYLEIEQMRFQDRLKVEMNIAPETLDAKVPNMILQPLVENAIKHGLAPRIEGGKIEIGAIRNNGSLNLSVSDDGIGISSAGLENLAEGVGLSNTKKRLKHLYGEAHKFVLAAENKGFQVNLTIPFKEIET